MTSVNKPVNYMRVYVTPAQFAEAYELRQSVGLRGDTTAEERLKKLLVRAAQENGGAYDPDKHSQGAMVELTVLV